MARLTSLSRSVAGRRVLITGAASGMGRATAHLFADEGAVVAVVDLEPSRVDAVVAEIRAVHGFWRAGEGPYVELVFEDGRRERVEFTIAATAAA